MKVYVEELHIKNCSCCDFCYANSQGAVCKLTGHLTKYDEALEEMRNNCPLQSLADYTKQVRKEVCEKITEELLDISHEYWKTFLRNGVQYMTSDDLYELLKEITKQIQGETK